MTVTEPTEHPVEDAENAIDGEGERVCIDPWRSTTQSVRYLVDDKSVRGLDIAHPEEAQARLRAECEGNTALINEVAIHMQQLYDKRGGSGFRGVYSSNLQLRALKRRLNEAVRAWVEGRPVRNLPSRPEILAVRYCDPRGELNASIAGHLAFLGLADLAQVKSFREKTEGAAGRSGSSADDAPTAQRVDGIAAHVESLGRRVDELAEAVGNGGATKRDLDDAM